MAIMQLFQWFRFLSHRRFVASSILTCALAVALLPASRTPPAQAQPPTLPPVSYDAANNTIHIGTDYSDALFRGHPAHPDAPKNAITIPELKTTLDDLVADAEDLLVDQGAGNWLLKADVIIHQTARLAATDTTITWLRLDSTTGYTRVVADGGHLLIQGIRVTSWDTGREDVDMEPTDGRSYLLAYQGGRMDIIDAEAAYLGWKPGEPSGLSWRKRATADRPETGSTGSILRSDIHDNYFGQYSYEAYGLQILESTIHHNRYYGIDPHDYSIEFEVAYNQVYRNGLHGIIFSRHCTSNRVHHNEVYDNDQHGIMFDRDSSGSISDNEVYGNRDGIAIFQASDVVIQNNTLRNNERGIRINATFDDDDQYDGIATNNLITGNTIKDNTEYGIYLYERADKNIIAENTISGNARSGIYIKTGGNTIYGNEIRANGNGIIIWNHQAYAIPDPLPAGAPMPVAAIGEPGVANHVYRNRIEDNDETGIRIRGGRDNLIGPRQIDQSPDDRNVINTNGSYGIAITDSATGNMVTGNSIQGNGADGVLVKGSGTLANTISRNSIAANMLQGITISDGANGGIAPPGLTGAPNAAGITGTAAPGATVEVYRDAGGQGQFYLGDTSADDAGTWSFALPNSDSSSQAPVITAVAIDAHGNTSAFGAAGGSNGTAATVVYELGMETHNDQDIPTIYVKNTSSDIATITLTDIQNGVRTLTTTEVLEHQGSGTWQLNASLLIRRNVKLELTDAEVTWLKLRSQGSDIALARADDDYNDKSFVTLRTYSGQILIDGVKVTSWDPQQDTYDTDISNGRSYILAKYDAQMDIYNANLSYLGSADSESYGVIWRDINDTDNPNELRARATGEVIDSEFSHNYYGVYTYQTSDMVFQGNTFHHNISYGFDPHDYSNNFLVEHNEAYANGNHGFIISRGCNNFVFRNNKSYNNRYSIDEKDRLAHGFMLDPGSPHSRYTQVPTFDNLFEHNEAWGNDGYGLRILGSHNNIIRSNIFRNNLQGITLEQGSSGNLVEDNTLASNALYGAYLFSGADENTVTGNTVTQNGIHGIYVKTGNTTITNNTITGNGSLVDDLPSGSGIAFLRESTAAAAVADWQVPGTSASLAESNPELVGDPALASAVQNNIVRENTVAGNADDGIELKATHSSLVEGNTIENNGVNGIYLAVNSRGNRIAQNTIRSNQGYGIKTNGEDTFANTWTENLVYANSRGGIVTTSESNDAIAPPTIIRQQEVISGTATPGAVVEIFSDTGGQGRYFEGRTTANADGTYMFTAAQAWQAPNINATATDANGNSSGFTYNVGATPGANDDDDGPTPVIEQRVYLPLVKSAQTPTRPATIVIP